MLLVSLVIVFPVIGLEQLLHTSPAVLRTLPLYEALHWVSDSLLALPLVGIAVMIGQLLAAHFGIGRARVSDLFTRACLIALVLAVLLVPGQALHDQADALTHAHTVLGVHSHAAFPSTATESPQALFWGQVVHGLTDGLTGQLVGLPMAFLALLWTRYSRRRLFTMRANPSSK
jgi:hypothetical protein